jgi:hypothetical protein
MLRLIDPDLPGLGDPAPAFEDVRAALPLSAPTPETPAVPASGLSSAA